MEVIIILKNMIDENKIAKAARQISENVINSKGFNDSKPTHLAFLDGHIDGFNAGAKWAINEFLKDLWHPAWKVPEDDRYILLEEKYSDAKSIMMLLNMILVMKSRGTVNQQD